MKTGRLGSPYFQEVAIVENTVSLSWMPPGGDTIVTGYKLYIADELGKVLIKKYQFENFFSVFLALNLCYAN